MNKYKLVNGISYHSETSEEVIKVLEHARQNRIRIVLDYGHLNTGQSWGETNGIAGTIGNSTGTIKIPLLVHNSKSIGGGSILDHRIVKISESKGKKVLYQHKNYHS